MDVLESQLKEYVAGDTQEPFDLAAIPEAKGGTGMSTLAAAVRGVVAAAGDSADAAPAPEEAAEEAGPSRYADVLASVPELAALGPVLHSSPETPLLEEGMEYRVSLVKHVFERAVLLQFACVNTIREQVLENVRVVVDLSAADELAEEFAIPLPAMPLEGAGQPGLTFVCLSKAPGALCVGAVGCTLSFTLKEVDPNSGEVEVRLGA